MQIHCALVPRAFHVEMHVEVIRPSPIFLKRRCNVAIPCPLVPRWLSIGFYGLAIAEDFEAARVRCHAGHNAVEVCGFAGAAEDVEVEESCDTALKP